MVWKYFDRNVQASKRNEFLVWTEIVALPFKFSSPYRIAAFFIKKGFETKLIMRRRMSDEGARASKYGVQEMAVVVGGKIKLQADFDEKDLERAILKAISY
jgi:hypothetical protein